MMKYRYTDSEPEVIDVEPIEEEPVEEILDGQVEIEEAIPDIQVRETIQKTVLGGGYNLVNVRSKPDRSSLIIGRPKAKGEVITVVNKVDGWYELETGGYILADLVDRE